MGIYVRPRGQRSCENRHLKIVYSDINAKVFASNDMDKKKDTVKKLLY